MEEKELCPFLSQVILHCLFSGIKKIRKISLSARQQSSWKMTWLHIIVCILSWWKWVKYFCISFKYLPAWFYYQIKKANETFSVIWHWNSLLLFRTHRVHHLLFSGRGTQIFCEYLSLFCSAEETFSQRWTMPTWGAVTEEKTRCVPSSDWETSFERPERISLKWP